MRRWILVSTLTKLVMVDLVALDAGADDVYPGAGVGMNVKSAVDPNTAPRRVIKDDRVSAPQEMRVRPSPRGKACPNDHSRTKAYRAPDYKSGSGWSEY